MPIREDDDNMESNVSFDALIDRIRARDGTPGPARGFSMSLERRLLVSGPLPRSDQMSALTRSVDHPIAWSPPRTAQLARWGALAATLALLLATVGGAAFTGVKLFGQGDPATGVAAPMTGSPVAEPLVTPAGSPPAVERRVGSCVAPKTYLSSVGGQMLLQSPQNFAGGFYPIDQMQLQHWSFGPGLGRAFPPSEMSAINGLVMDTVTNGVYRATFEGPVVVSTWYGSWLAGWTYSELTNTVNTLELGVGESVLYQAGTAHGVENTSGSRGLGVKRLILYSGDGSGLIPVVKPVERPSEAVRSYDTELDGRAGIAVRLDGTGTIAPNDALTGWKNALITIEFVILDDPMTVLVPSCEPFNPRQVRNVDEMLNSVPPPTGEPATDQYIGYLVWLGEGGRG